jgi:plasmid stabilization system protein ParE
MKIIWSSNAKTRLIGILDYIAQDDPITALNFVDEIEIKVAQLAQNPESGRLLDEIQSTHIRELVVHRNYGVIYEIEESSINILTVRHFGQLFDESKL